MKGFLIGVLICILALTGCATVDTASEEAVAIENGETVGMNGIPRPDWVESGEGDGDMLYATGYSNMSSEAISLRRARTDARNEIGSWLLETIGSISASLDDGDAFAEAARQSAEALLSSAEEVDRWVDANGGVWVLMGLSMDSVNAGLDEAIAASGTSASAISQILSSLGI